MNFNNNAININSKRKKAAKISRKKSVLIIRKTVSQFKFKVRSRKAKVDYESHVSDSLSDNLLLIICSVKTLKKIKKL